jgi:hypothetical protein
VIVVDCHEDGGQALPIDLKVPSLTIAARLAPGTVARIATGLFLTDSGVRLRHSRGGGYDRGGKTLYQEIALVVGTHMANSTFRSSMIDRGEEDLLKS